MKNGDRAQIGIVKNMFQFEPARTWHPLDHYVASLLDDVYNGVIIRFFKTGRFSFRMPGVSLDHSNDRYVTRDRHNAPNTCMLVRCAPMTLSA